MGFPRTSKLLNDIRDIMTFDIHALNEKKSKIFYETFVNRNENVVPLHSEKARYCFAFIPLLIRLAKRASGL